MASSPMFPTTYWAFAGPMNGNRRTRSHAHDPHAGLHESAGQQELLTGDEVEHCLPESVVALTRSLGVMECGEMLW